MDEGARRKTRAASGDTMAAWNVIDVANFLATCEIFNMMNGLSSAIFYDRSTERLASFCSNASLHIIYSRQFYTALHCGKILKDFEETGRISLALIRQSRSWKRSWSGGRANRRNQPDGSASGISSRGDFIQASSNFITSTVALHTFSCTFSYMWRYLSNWI